MTETRRDGETGKKGGKLRGGITKEERKPMAVSVSRRLT